MRLQLLSIVLLLSANSALADVPPPQAVINAQMSQYIVAAGHKCDSVVSARYSDSEEYADLRERQLSPFIVVCEGERSFLVAAPPRRWRSASPSPEAVVTPLK